jgi:protein TonB
MRVRSLFHFHWTYSLANAPSLPVTGDFHPLKKEAGRWLSWSNAFILFLGISIFGAWYLWSHRTKSEDTGEGVRIVQYREMGVPPSIAQPSAPQVSVAEAAPPAIGIPEPVPEVEAQQTTIATQEEMSQALAPITMSDLGAGSGDSLVVRIDEHSPSPDEFVLVEEEPIRLSIAPPVYPPLAREAGLEGTVMIRALVGKDGRVKKAIVVSGGAETLRAAAIACAMSAVFKPALQRNRPVEVWVMMPIQFKLH